MRGNAGRERMPDFIAVGPPRTGTTWLHGVLCHCANVPRGLKETHFFDTFHSKGLDWYLRYFDRGTHGRPIGEITPAYFGSAIARERIARDLCKIKIVITLRDPVARAYSQYRKMMRGGLLRGSFQHEVAANAHMRESSRYGFHLERWREQFGADNVAVFFFDDLATAPQRFADGACDFIGAGRVPLTPEVAASLDRNEVTRGPRWRALAYAARHLQMWLGSRGAFSLTDALRRAGIWRLCFESGAEFPPLSAEADARMREFFLPEVEAVERIVKCDLSAWKPPPMPSSASAVL